MIRGTFNQPRADKIQTALERYCDAWNAFDRADDDDETMEASGVLRDAQTEIEMLLGAPVERPVREGRYLRVVGAKLFNGLNLRRV